MHSSLAQRFGLTGLLAGVLTVSLLSLPALAAEPAPTVALSGPTSAQEGTSAQITATVTVSTANNTYSTRRWTDTAGWLSAAHSTGATVSVPAGTIGKSTTVTLTVTDEFGGSASDSITVTSSGTSPDTLTVTGPSAVTADAGQVVPLKVTANRAGVQVWWSTTDSQCHLTVGADQTGATLGCPVDVTGNVHVAMTVYDPPTGDTADWQTTVSFTGTDTAEPGTTDPATEPVPTEPESGTSAPPALGQDGTVPTVAYTYGQPGTFGGAFTGTLTTTGGTPLSGEPVALQSRLGTATAWTTVRTVTTGPAGTVRVPLSATTAGMWRLAHAGNAQYAASSSATVHVRVETRLTLTLRPGQAGTIGGRLANSANAGVPNQAVVLQAHRRGMTAWTAMSNGWTGADGRVTFPTRPKSYLLYRLVTVQTADAQAARSNVRGRRSLVGFAAY